MRPEGCEETPDHVLPPPTLLQGSRPGQSSWKCSVQSSRCVSSGAARVPTAARPGAMRSLTRSSPPCLTSWNLPSAPASCDPGDLASLQLRAALGAEGLRTFPRAPQGHCDQPKNVLGSTPGSPLHFQGPEWTPNSSLPSHAPSLPSRRTGTSAPPTGFRCPHFHRGSLFLSHGRLPYTSSFL